MPIATDTRIIRNPSSQEGTYGQNIGVLKKFQKSDNGKVVKIIKVHFHNSSLIFVVVVVVVVLQFQPPYLKTVQS